VINGRLTKKNMDRAQFVKETVLVED